jgi:hypothetical protein
MIACVFLLRLPAILYPHELNPDESQMFSQGMKFLLDPVPWRSVDGTTGGPLNSYVVTLVLWLGIKPGYVMGHTLAAALICLQLVVAYRTLLRLGSQRTAAWGMAPIVLFFCVTGINDYLHYSSELLPALLLSLGFYCAVAWMQDCRERSSLPRALLVFLSGLLWGAAPWSKLQAGPISGVLGIWMLWAIARGAAGPLQTSRKVMQSLIFGAGALLPAAVILGTVVRSGVYRDFWLSYIVTSLEFTGTEPWTRTLLDCLQALFSIGIGPLSLMSMLGAGLLVYGRRTSKGLDVSPRQRWLYGGLLLYFGAGLFAVARPSTFFLHRLVFLVYPMACVAAGLVSRAMPVFRSQLQGGRKLPVPVLALLGAIMSYYLFNAALYVAFCAVTIPEMFHPQPDSNDRIAAVIEKLKTSRPVASMAIWGWASGVYVVSGIPPATRDAVTTYAIEKWPTQAYFGHRFVSDLRNKTPDLFVDAMAPGTFTWWKELSAYESNSELKSYIDENYVLVDQLALVPGAKPVRFFARRQSGVPQQSAAVTP